MNRTTCAHCRKKLHPDRPGQKVHTECAADYILAQKAKQERLEARRKRESDKVDRQVVRQKKQALKTIPQLIKEAQTVFNRWIRARDHDKPCISCGAPPPDLSQLHAGRDSGHWRSTGSASHLRFNEDNCHAQCVKCNQWGAGRAVDYRIGLVERIGISRVESLENDNTPHKWTRDELIEIRERYKQKLKYLKNASADQVSSS